MSTINIIFAVAVVVLVIILIVQRKQIMEVSRSVLGPSAHKAEVETDILKLLQEKGELSNSDIRNALGISDRSVVRHMQELEDFGKVEQVGSTGRDRVYKLR